MPFPRALTVWLTQDTDRTLTVWLRKPTWSASCGEWIEGKADDPIPMDVFTGTEICKPAALEAFGEVPGPGERIEFVMTTIARGDDHG